MMCIAKQWRITHFFSIFSTYELLLLFTRSGFESTWSLLFIALREVEAMAMFLDTTPVFLIMLIRDWGSERFLKQIRKQILE